MRLFCLIILLAGLATDVRAEEIAPDEAAVRAVVADWYRRLQEPERTHWMLYAAGGIDGRAGRDQIHPEWRSRSPTISNELAAQALEFAYAVDGIVVDPRLAKVTVWERGYFYASAAGTTYERAASTLFVLEKQKDGHWLILAHEAQSVGIPPNKITDPMPDLRAALARAVRDRTAAADSPSAVTMASKSGRNTPPASALSTFSI